jgi:hypothetical protein
MQAPEQNISLMSNSSWAKSSTGGMDPRYRYGQMLFKEDNARVPGGVSEHSKSLEVHQIGVYQTGTKTSNYFVAGMALAGLYATGAYYLGLHSSGSVAWLGIPTSHTVVGYETPLAIPVSAFSPATSLINEAKEISGLTLEMLAPLLGVSRRSIQYWKNGQAISERKEEQLRDLIDALKQISTGNAVETRGLLLARITGVPRIYDLLAERRYDAAALRAKNPSNYKPILSDPTIKFDHRPIEDQLSIVDDVVPANGFKLNRAMSRRLPIKS